ncbi:UDP-N-acetylglucosamine 2-epimerase [Acetobacterium woodii]|uniref:N-acetylglucosamine-6-phosphate 2-epimerase/N-acetylglucosamine-6-phosphatase NeuC n=1 Tax=Acetobacterium woodii (strain ATCC 29683 / DSM 1030 / JCM 2381 / KCTC 1655 / WB1) TaxID=931626 RepID=H6LDS6_ACEWD|nr:UDP-N-acetylglucosamine 2-epimerase [Acetobacterium woodii]AFA49240.1 N-acetylglucosamine-6-phosphate 2-epimerase/N-acetylglucosamine-6-phosphatase NeuC [Acetobacterium woodii DSM 1030]
MKKICVITSTRAEYGLLKNLIRKIDDDAELDLCLVVTGTHLSSEFGMTIHEIEEDGFPIAERIDILLSSDTMAAISKTMGLALILFSDVFQRQNPDMLIVLGDRYELIPICSCAMNAQVPISHISGGETTEGVIDECVRHCITKMSYLHFPACELYRKRIIQLGETPNRVFNFGDIGVEVIRTIDLYEKKEMEEIVGFSLERRYGCITFHPITLESELLEKQINELLIAITEFPKMHFIFTKSNSDANSRMINKKIDEYVAKHKNCVAFKSLGIRRYLSCVKYADVIIGNSSSGIVEAPSFGIPSVNIGDRQKGRLQASSVINCRPEANDIINAIDLSQTESFRIRAKNTINPYASGNTVECIINVIKDHLFEDKIDLKKKFYDVNFEVKE